MIMRDEIARKNVQPRYCVYSTGYFPQQAVGQGRLAKILSMQCVIRRFLANAATGRLIVLPGAAAETLKSITHFVGVPNGDSLRKAWVGIGNVPAPDLGSLLRASNHVPS
jgi:hypothetical protein